MRQMLLRTLIVAATVWAVACMDNSTQPVLSPAFAHLEGGSAHEHLEDQIRALFPPNENGKGKTVGGLNAILKNLDNITRQLERQPHAVQNMGKSIAQQMVRELSEGNLRQPPYTADVFESDPQDASEALDELFALLTAYVAGSFVVEIVPDLAPGEKAEIKTKNKFAGVVIEGEDLEDIVPVLISIQELAIENCLSSSSTTSQLHPAP